MTLSSGCFYTPQLLNLIRIDFKSREQTIKDHNDEKTREEKQHTKWGTNNRLAASRRSSRSSLSCCSLVCDHLKSQNGEWEMCNRHAPFASCITSHHKRCSWFLGAFLLVFLSHRPFTRSKWLIDTDRIKRAIACFQL